ncbi:MAG: hypothetical protein ACREJD_02120 [Phycisphaerales bacterium]
MTKVFDGDITVEYVADVGDLEKAYVRAFLAQTRQGKSITQAARTRRTYLIVMILSCAAALGLVCSMAADWIEPRQFWAMLIIVPPAISIAAYSNSNPKKNIQSLTRHAERSARSPSARVVLGRYFVTIQSEGLRFTGEQFEQLYRWPIVLRVGEDDGAIYVESAIFGEFRIPKRAFAGEVSQQQFVEALEQKIATLGFDVSTRLLMHFNAVHAKCPSCGYPLTDLDKPQCPECGRVSTLEDFPDAIDVTGARVS